MSETGSKKRRFERCFNLYNIQNSVSLYIHTHTHTPLTLPTCNTFIKKKNILKDVYLRMLINIHLSMPNKMEIANAARTL